MPGTFTERDRQAARETHRLFWRAKFVDWPDFVIWALTRPAAVFVYYVLIPFQIAYGLQAIITRHFDRVGHYAVTIVILAIVYCVLWAVGGLAVCENGRHGTLYVQRKVFENYLNKDYEFLNNSYLGSLGSQATRLRDAFNDYSQIVLNGFVFQFVVMISSIVIVGLHSLVLALVTLVTVVLLVAITYFTTHWRLKYRRLMSEASSETAGIIGDALGHGSTVKSFAAEEHEKHNLDPALQKLVDAIFWSWASSIPADVVRMLFATVATVLLLLMTSRLYQNGSIPVAIVILIQLYVIRLILSTTTLTDLLKQYETAMSSAHESVKTMLIEPTVKDKAEVKTLPKNAQLNIAINKVSLHYADAPKKVLAVKNFSLEINQGQKIGLVGYSGSGKTTLTKLLLRFMDVTGGSIKIAGVDIRDLSQKELRTHLAYVPQEPLLFHRSIAENIAYGKPTASRKEIITAAKTAYVDEFVGDLAKGYDTLVGEKGIKLSGGQRQRVAIARALLKNSPILVLDEATSSLDSRSEQYIQKALWELMKGRTAIVIAHRLSTIQHMDRIVVMDKGKVAEVGTHEQLLKNKKGIYAKLWAHQSGGYLAV